MAVQIRQSRPQQAGKTYTRGSWTLTVEDSVEDVYLLIGSTGQGKSTLGNFLLTDVDTLSEPFQSARSNKPETRRVEVRRALGGGLRVIDTPGLNESDSDDLEHMIEITKKLKKLQYVKACIFCIKFESKIDAQCKATVAYYRHLLPMLFESNVVVVVTNFLTDDRSEKVRKSQGIDVDGVISNFLDEFVKIGHLTYRPQAFKIDSYPYDDAERRVSRETRRAILGYVSDTMVPIDVRELKVAKTDALLQKDRERIAEMNGEITGYNKRLQQANRQAKEVLDQIEAQEKEMTKMNLELDDLELDLGSKDTEEPLISAQWSLEKGWKLFRKQTVDFKVTSEWPITHWTTSDNGKLQWKEIRKVGNTVHCTIEGKFFRGLCASIALWTTKRHKYARDIDSLKGDISEKESTLADSEKRYGEYKNRHRNHSAVIQDLEKHIEEINGKKRVLSRREMTIDEATIRLQELKLLCK